MANQNQPSPPERSFRYGSCSAAVFTGEAQSRNGGTFTTRRIVLERRYLDQDGTWQSTNSYFGHHVMDAILALQDAYRHCREKARSDREPGEEG